MLKTFFILVLLVLGPTLVSAQVAKELVGKYQMDVQDGDFMELRSDGSASMAGEETRWSARGNQLTVGTDVMSYSLAGGRLVVMFGPVQLAWKKVGGAPKGLTPMEKVARGAQRHQAQGPAAAGGNAQGAQVVFRPDGVMTINGGRETYSSGYAGTYAGQSNSSGAMQWKLDNLRLFVDQGDGSGFQDIELKATRNSNGYTILHAGGLEYSMCN